MVVHIAACDVISGRLFVCQILVIDGDELQTHPVDVMRSVQDFLEIQPKIDYANKIRSVTTSTGTGVAVL